jgi:predicted RND superfamily exporter protein
MRVESSDRGGTYGHYIVAYRLPIAVLIIAITAFMSYWAIRVPIATRFEDLFPAGHPNTMLYRKYRKQYGGALTLALLLRVEQGGHLQLQDAENYPGYQP